MKATEPRLGVDIGRVIIDGSSHPSGDDTAFLSGSEADILATPAMAGAFTALARLNTTFAGRVWLVSKCRARVQARTERWLAHNLFFPTTGIEPSHVRFCLERADKAIHCAELGITHFVDDRRDVLDHLVGIVPYLFLFGPQKRQALAIVVPTVTWAEAEAEIIATLRAHRQPAPAGDVTHDR